MRKTETLVSESVRAALFDQMRVILLKEVPHLNPKAVLRDISVIVGASNTVAGWREEDRRFEAEFRWRIEKFHAWVEDFDACKLSAEDAWQFQQRVPGKHWRTTRGLKEMHRRMVRLKEATSELLDNLRRRDAGRGRPPQRLRDHDAGLLIYFLTSYGLAPRHHRHILELALAATPHSLPSKDTDALMKKARAKASEMLAAYGEGMREEYARNKARPKKKTLNL